jgi:hypothetical protein
MEGSLQKSPIQEINSYLKMASYGHYPLFFDEWMLDLSQRPKRLSYSKAKTTVKKTFKNLQRHHSAERKKIALLSMNETERKDFIFSFMKMLEHEMVTKIENLH